MHYLRRNKLDKPIYLCPQCGADIHIPEELYKLVLKRYRLKLKLDKAKQEHIENNFL